MALTPDQKEAIMAARGESAQPVTTGSMQYLVTFADGTRAYVLDMLREPEEDAIRAIRSISKPWATAQIKRI